MDLYPEKRSGILSDPNSEGLSEPKKMSNSPLFQPWKMQLEISDQDMIRNLHQLEALQKKQMEGILHSNQAPKPTVSSQDYVKGDSKSVPDPSSFTSSGNPFITGTEKYSQVKKNRSHKAVLMIKPGVLTSSPILQRQVLVFQTQVSVPLQPVFVPQQPAFVPQQPAFVLQQPAFVPQQPAFVPQQPAFVPQQPAFVPQQPAFVPQQPAFVPQQPAFVPQQTAVRLCLSEVFDLAQELENNPGDFTLVFDFVKTNREAILLLGRNSNNYVAIGDHFFFPSILWQQQEPWKEFYLATGTRLAVLGIMCPLVRCLVLLGEDGHVYAYEMETDITYRIGNSLKQLLQDGITPAKEQCVDKFEGLWEIEEDEKVAPLLKQAAKASFDDGSDRSDGRKAQYCDGISKKLIRIDPNTLAMHLHCGKFCDFKFCICEVQELIQYLEQKSGDLDVIMKFVERTENALLPLGNHSNTYLEIADLRRHNLWWPGFRMESWTELYLPTRTRVAVLGIVRPFPTWIVLLGEDGRVYAYEHDVIHLIGNSLKDLLQHGIQYGSTMYWQKLPGSQGDKRISWITRDHSSDGGWEFRSENTSEDPVKSSIPMKKKKKKKKHEEVTSAYMVPFLSYENHQQGLSLAKKLIEELERKSGDLSLISNFVANQQMTFLPIGKHRRIYLKIDHLPHLLPLQRTMVNYFPRIRRINILGRMYPFFSCIVFLSEKGHVYACAEQADFGDVIFLIANSLQELLQDGINYTGTMYWRKNPEDFSDEDKKISGVQSKTEASASDSGTEPSSSRLSTSGKNISKETETSNMPKAQENSVTINRAHAECSLNHANVHRRTSESGIPKVVPSQSTIIPTHTESSLSHEPEQRTTESELVHKLENLGQELQQNHGDLIPVSNFVKAHEKARVPLKGSNTMYLRLCDLSGTEYMGRTYMLRSWEELYLPEPTKMEVLGTLESTRGMLPCPQWIVLVGKDRHVYAYEDETIHLIADSLQALVQSGINPKGATYKFPENIPPEDEDILQQDPEIKAIRQRTRDLLVKNDDNFDDW